MRERVIARMRQWALPVAALLVLLAWLEYLRRFVPSVSRGDFFLAMMREEAAFRDGHWLYAVTWPFHILGGHIVFYERVLQLVNYYLLGYSHGFVKFAALAAWVFLAVGLWRFVRRQPLGQGAQAGMLLALAVVSFNPIPWETLTWPDSTIPYLTPLVALLFVVRPLVDILNGPGIAGRWGKVALLCALVIFGSGVGWAIIPTVMWMVAVNGIARQRYQGLKAMATVGIASLALATVLLVFFPNVLRLGLVTESLDALPNQFGHFVSYFFSLFATLFGVHERPLSIWVGAGVFSASFLVYLLYKRRFREVSEEEVLYIFGLGSIALVTLGRWKLNIDRGSAVTYYHLFALPAFYGMLVMGLRLLPPRAIGLGGAGVAVVIAAAMAPSLGFYHGNMVGQSEAYTRMIAAVRGWRMTEATRLIGSPQHNQKIFFEYLPTLKEQHRYRRLAADFHPYRSTRMAPPAITANGRTCNSDYRNLELLETRVDDRAEYTWGEPQHPFHRFAGIARNPADCDQEQVAVSLVDAAGVVQCKSWTTPRTYWHFDPPQHREIVRSPFAYDFSCPMEAGDYYLVAQDRAGRILETLKVPR